MVSLCSLSADPLYVLLLLLLLLLPLLLLLLLMLRCCLVVCCDNCDSQYPRCTSKSNGDEPWDYPSDNACTSVASNNFSAMGYSIRSDRWRYTLWLAWDGEKLDKVSWDAIHGEELYDHQGDDGRDTDKFDNVNLGCSGAEYAPVCAAHKAAMEVGWRAAKPKH